MSKKEVVHSFALGDYVKFVSASERNHTDYLGREGHISGVSIHGGGLQYGFEGSSWFPHSCFELILRATPAALAHVAKLQYDEEFDEDDDEPEHEDEDDEGAAEAAAEDGITEVAEWFDKLDGQVKAEVLGRNIIRVTGDDVSLFDIFGETTHFGLDPSKWPVNCAEYMVRVTGEDSHLVFGFENADDASVTIQITPREGREMGAWLMNEYDAYGL